jgi:hypothetical protein
MDMIRKVAGDCKCNEFACKESDLRGGMEGFGRLGKFTTTHDTFGPAIRAKNSEFRLGDS